MTYMSPETWTGESVSAAEALRFTPTELRVINLAEQRDAARERTGDSRFARLLEWAFGFRLARPLADPHLEALRRFASKARHHRDALKDEDVEALVAAGYTAGQAWGLTGYLAGRPRSGAHA